MFEVTCEPSDGTCILSRSCAVVGVDDDDGSTVDPKILIKTYSVIAICCRSNRNGD